jgi:hypothetical protein
MSKIQHDFQPIIDEGRYNLAVDYVFKEASKLALKVLEDNLPIDTVTIFSQSLEEYEFLEKYLKSQGRVSSLSHGATLYIEKLADDKNSIKLLGVRQVDTSRPEVGYADYPVANYDELKNLNINNPNDSEITSGSGMPLLEIKHPDFDVRGYVVEEKEHE